MHKTKTHPSLYWCCNWPAALQFMSLLLSRKIFLPSSTSFFYDWLIIQMNFFSLDNTPRSMYSPSNERSKSVYLRSHYFISCVCALNLVLPTPPLSYSFNRGNRNSLGGYASIYISVWLPTVVTSIIHRRRNDDTYVCIWTYDAVV